jgi:hypothetical protein
MVSINVNDILPLMKWVKIFDLIIVLDPTPNFLMFFTNKLIFKIIPFQ